jgi:predicted ATPase
MSDLRLGARYINSIRLADISREIDGYPFNLPVVRQLAEQTDGLVLPPGVTFLVGENGSGKSTLIEAIAVACGMNAEGGSQSYRFATRSSESPLAEHIQLRWGVRKPRSKFFLRAESYYNVATETERLGPAQIALFGGVSPHERSHGESFIDVMTNADHRTMPIVQRSCRSTAVLRLGRSA